jgi:putative effector of murein hydrolase
VAVLGIFVMIAGGIGWLPSTPALVVVLAGAIGTLLGIVWGMRVEHHW